MLTLLHITLQQGVTVTNSFGCHTSATKSNIVTIIKAPKVSFTASQTAVCNVTTPVTFTNTTSGALPTTYLWSFGDGTTSTDQNPVHSFVSKGKFSVNVLATNSEGCSDTAKSTLISVATSQSFITPPTLFCLNSKLTFTDSSSPVTNNPQWLMDGNVVASNIHQYAATFTDTNAHQLQLVNIYGTCTDTATTIVKAQTAPQPSPFTTTIQGYCQLPAGVAFADAGSGSVKWEWDLNNTTDSIFNPTAFTKATTYTYSTENTYYVKLRVTDASGCTGTIRQPVVIKKNKTTITSTEGVYGCKTLTTTFKASSTNPVATYNWTFNDDNSTSLLDTPQHVYLKKGYFKTSLTVTTTNGCTDTASLKMYIGDQPKFDFALSAPTDTLVCGNKMVSFKVTGDSDHTVGQYFWNFGDAKNYVSFNNSVFTHQYLTDSSYDVTLAIVNHGCNDTLTKKNLLRVLPPFPKIASSLNTCDDRLKFTFKEASKKAQTYSWNFGDGTSGYTYDSTDIAPQIVHNYANTGFFKVVLTTTNNNCIAGDSMYVRVLKKQTPILTAPQIVLCTNDTLHTLVSGMDVIPYGAIPNYKIQAVQYADGTPFTGFFSLADSTTPQNPFYVNIKGINPAEKSLRIVTASNRINCFDTSNYVSVQVKGPVAGFEVANSSICFSDKVIFTDTSKGDNSGIKSRQWLFGDSTSEIHTTGGNVSHKYANLGNFGVKLVVTDAENCSDTAYYAGNNITIKGPKAGFAVAQNPILPDIPEAFTNLTDSGLAARANNSYNWSFGDGGSSNINNDSVSHIYKLYSNDTVSLIAKSSTTGCSDTVTAIVKVKNINLSFTYTSSYLIPTSTCPPVLVKFTNTSVNFSTVSWDFGDSLTADNINTPTHTYYKPGVYKVTIFGYHNDNTYDSSWDYITVSGPTAVLQADVLTGCGSRQVVFTAKTQNSTSASWDFGDGTTSSDSVVSHIYTTPNLYIPSLTVKNGNQCSFSYYLSTPVAIDSLNLSLSKDSLIQCNQLQVNLIPKLFSVAKNNGQPLTYTWQSGAGESSSNKDTGSFIYKKAGNYTASLIVTSPYGCTDTATAQIAYSIAEPVTIDGPVEMCENTPVSFRAIKANNTDVLTYNWQFQNSNSTLQNPPSQTFTASGNDSIRLVVNKNGCNDTIYQKLTIHQQPNVTMLLSDSSVCLGSPILFDVKPANNSSPDTNTYFWNLGDGKDSAAVKSPSFIYAAYGTYPVLLRVTSSFGCQQELKNTVAISPVPQATITAPTDICKNSSASFTSTSTISSAQYLWHFSDNTTSDKQNPDSKTYSTAGTDNVYLVTSVGNCRDTAYHKLIVHDYPQINLTSSSLNVCLGDSVQLMAHNGQTYQWLANNVAITGSSFIAAQHLLPLTDTKYSVSVADINGCKNQDSLTVAVVKPQHISVTSPINVCAGNKASLAATGTDTYNWIDGSDLTSATIADPITIDSAQNKTYTVVGSDAYGCFEDTGRVEVVVKNNPLVETANTITAPAGFPTQLSATSSGDIVKWNWQPAMYLTCNNCAAPIGRFRESTHYTVEATDNYGCKGTDTVLVTVVCKESLVGVPDVFTPNGDGKNDRFGMAGYGIKTITHFVIFGRNGNKVFERNNVNPLDTNASWDGTCNNTSMPTGTYVYMIRAICDAGEVYNLQGTVVLIR